MTIPGLEQLEKIVMGLVQPTKDRKVEWSTRDGETLTLAIPSGTILLTTRDRDGEPPYKVEIYDASGTAIESFAKAINRAPTPEEADLDTKIKALYAVARRNAMNVDKVLDAIIDDLGLS